VLQFSLCFGFAADFYLNLTNGVFSAVPWFGAFSLLFAVVTPIAGTIGVLSDLFTSKAFIDRLQEVKVPPFFQKICSKIPLLSSESFIVEFGPIGRALQKAGFYIAMVNSFLSVTLVGVSWLTADMYKIEVQANWKELSATMPDMDMNQAMDRVAETVSGL